MKNIVLFISFLITFVIGLYINSSVISFKDEQKISATEFWTKKAQHYRSGKKYDYLIIGDSRSLRGIDPNLMTKLGEGYNFSFPSAGLTPNYLEHALKLLKDDGILLVSITPFAFSGLASRNEKLNQFNDLSLDQYWLNSSKILTKLFLPITAQKFSQEKPKVEKTFFENGYIESFSNEPDVIEGVNSYIKNFRKESYFFSYLKHFFKVLKTKEKIKQVYAFRMPIYSQVKAVEDQLGKFNERDVIEVVRHHGFKWLEVPENEDYRTYDGSHLVTESAERFTKQLQNLILENN